MSKYYRLKSGSHGRWEGDREVTYNPGDLVPDLTKEELKEHGSRFVEVTQAEIDKQKVRSEALAKLTGKTGDAEDADGDYDWTEVLGGNLAEVVEYVEETLDDEAMLKSIIKAESAGQNRKGVLTAASNRLKALAKGK